MKKLFQLAFLICSILGFTVLISCGDDGEDGSNPNGNTEFDFGDYNISGGAVYDYGDDGTHYNYDFDLFDGTLDTSEDTFSGTLFLYVELFSLGTTGFQDGIFEYYGGTDFSDVEEKNYFTTLRLSYDGNDNGRLYSTNDEFEEDITLIPSSGSITVSDNGNNNFTLAFNLEMVQALISPVDFEISELVDGTNTSVVFTTTLNFEYIDERAGRLPVSGKNFFLKR